MNKKNVSDEIRQRKREEKLQRESIVQDLTVASPSYNSEKDDQIILKISEEFEKTVPSANDQSLVTSVEPDLIEQDNDELILEELLDKNQIVEQDLIVVLMAPVHPYPLKTMSALLILIPLAMDQRI